MISILAEVTTILFMLALLFFAGVGFSAFVRGLLDSPDRHRMRHERRIRQAQQEIINIGQWEQQEIIAEVLRRAANGRPDTRPAPPPQIIDGEWTE